MGGDVEGVVAIVQGLRVAGLAVTVMGGERAGLASVNAPPDHLPPVKSSMETTTCVLAADAVAQICDDRYTSTYQLAHCFARPTSPPVSPPEYPRRRSELCRTQGNFEIGVCDSSGTRSPIKINLYPRNGSSSPDRGSLSPTQSSRGAEAFVNSLRKYPSVSPDKSCSSDLVQRLIAYTQAKNFSKGSYHPKNMRNLRNKRSLEQSKEIAKSKSIGVQTYTRTGAKTRDEDSAKKESKASARKCTASPVHDSRNSRHKDKQLSDTYEYLSSPSPLPPCFSARATDVRYLSDVTRCLRDTLRQVCDENTQAVFQVCPNIQNRYSRHRREHHSDRAHMCTSSNNMEAQTSVPLVSFGVPAFSTCEPVPGTYIQTCPLQSATSCLCHKPLPCNCRPRSSAIQLERLPTLRDTGTHPSQASIIRKQADEDFKKKLEKQVGAWLQEVPVYVNDKPENKVIRERKVKDLIEKLKSLERDDNFVDNAKNEILECVDNLPMWYPGDKRDQNLFKTKIIDNLMNKILNSTEFPSKERTDSVLREGYGKQIFDWIEDIPELSNVSASNVRANQKLGAMLAEKLKKVQTRGDDKDNVQEEMQNEINNDWLESNISRLESNISRLDPRIKTELSKRLLRSLAKTLKDASKEKGKAEVDVLTKQIKEWLEDVPKLLGSKPENQKVAEKLANKLLNYFYQNEDDSEFRDEISKWLTNTLDSKGERLDSRTKNDLMDNLFYNMNTKSDEKNVETFSNEISNILEHISNLYISPSKREKLADQTATKMHELQSQTYGEDDSEAVKNEIVDWVNELSKNNEINLNSKDKEKLRNKFMALILGTPNRRKCWSKQEDLLLHAINDDISGIFRRNSVNIDKANIKEIQNKISALIYKNLYIMKTNDDPNILIELFNILEEDARLPARKAKQIADEILNKVKLPGHSSTSQEADSVNAFNEEVSNILYNSDVYFDNRDEVKSILTHILADQAMRGESDEQTKARLLEVLKNSNFSYEESKQIASQLMGKGKELSSSNRSKRNTTQIFNESSQCLQSIPPVHKQMLVDSAQKDILEFIEELTNDSSVSSTKNRKAAAYRLADNVGDIVSNPNTTSLDKEDLLKDKIVEYLEENDIQSGSNSEAQANKLIERLKKLVSTTSTPKRLDESNSFYPNRYFENTLISTIGYDTYHKQQVPTNEEVQYTSQLVDKIDSWIKTLPINMDSAESKGFKETMIRDLAGDIIDRQKYLQLNPTVKPSDEEELEHLKYQVFRRLNKLPDSKQLMPFLAKTNELMESIKEAPVPQLTKENRFRDSLKVPDLSSIVTEISKWIEAVPSHQYTSLDKNHQQQMIRELAENIQNNQKNNTLTEPVLDVMIIEWLQEMLNDSKQSLFDLSEGLKAILTNRGIISFVQDIQLKREKSRIMEEDIRSHILGWLKEKPLYLRRNSMEKREQEQIITQLSKAIKDAAVAETNNLQKYTVLLEEIKSRIKKLQNDSHLKNDDKFLHDTAKDLLAYLKESKVFRDITANRSQMSQTVPTDINPGFKAAADMLYNNIENWYNDLPIFGGDTPEEMEKIKTVKQNVASKLINKIGELNLNPEIFNDDSMYEDLLKDEIDDLLSSLSQTDELHNKTAALKDGLIDRVREARQKTQSELEGHAYKQQLCDAISTNLPSVTNLTMDEQVPFELLKYNLADAFINLHYTPDNNELQNKLKQKILDEINTFCNDYLKRLSASPVDAKKLNQQLYTAMQKVPTPKGETIKAQVEQVRIKDAIHEWLKNLPVKDDSPTQQMQKNKIVSVLAKLLHETEKEKVINPDVDVVDKMRKDITKWTKKLPLKPGEEPKIDKEVNKLIDRLKSTKDSRRFSISNIKSTNGRLSITDTKNQTKARLLEVLKNSNFSYEESKQIASQLMGKGKELSPSNRSEKNTTHMFNESSQRLQSIPPMHKHMFMNSAQKDNLEFIDELTNDSSVSSTKNRKAAAYRLADNVGDIVSHPNTTSLDKEDLLKDKIVEYLEENDIQSGSSSETQANKLIERIKKLVFTTSSPRKLDESNSFYPTSYFKNTLISTIGYDSYHRQQVPTNEEVQYTSQLVDKIDSWIKTLPINMDSAESKGFKETMIRDLAGDIIDRQKYLQLNPTIKPSDDEELEHLKYQVYRWLNKLPDGKQLMPFLTKTNELMESIKEAPVPQLTEENRFRDSLKVSDLSSIVTEISKWIEAVPSHQYTLLDKNHQQQMIRELAENIQNNQKNNTLTEPVLDVMINEWLQEMLNDSKQSLFDLSEGLKAILTNRGIISFVQDIQLKREKSRIMEEDIRSHILGWLKEKPLYLRRNSMEKREQEQIITQLSKAIKDAAVAETNNLQKYTILLEEIKSRIKRLPIDSHLKNDNKFLHDTAKDLLAYLKESKVFRDITANRSQMSQTVLTDTNPGFKAAADMLYDNIENWCNDLPIFGGDTPEEMEKIKTVKQNIASKLINKIGELNLNPEIFNDDSMYEDLLKDEIDDLLSSLPQTDELHNKTAALKDGLIERVREAKQKTQSELEGHAYKKQLCDAISTTLPSVTNLTMDEQVPFELLKYNLADAFINLHYTPDNNELQNKLKQKILDEINTFCNDYLKRLSASPVDAIKLNQQLYTALQKVPTPKGETIKAQVEQVRIKDAIHEWFKNLPVKDDSPTQQMQKNKVVSVLAKLLHETEKEKVINPDVDVEDKMRKDITKWTKKLSLKPGEEPKIDKEVNKLIDRLKSTKDSRRFSISNIKSMNGRLPITDTKNDRLKIQPSYADKLSQCQHLLPPSCLCLEDRAHLERIRQRVHRPFQLSPEGSHSKDTYVNPIPVDESSQTDIGLQNGQPLSPNVVINEYDWNSTEASRIQESYNGTERNMLGHSYPMMPPQMSPQYAPSQQQSMSWPQPSAQRSMRTGATPQNQYGPRPQTPSIPPPPPCTMSRRLCMPSPPCSTTKTPCAPPPPLRAPQTRPCVRSSPTCVSPPPPCSFSSPPCARPTLPCTRPTLPCDSPSPPYTRPTMPCAPPPCIFQQPCMTPTSSIRQMRSFSSRVPCSPSREVSSGPSRRWAPMQPQHLNSSDFSSISSPFDEYPEGGTSRSFREPPRVTRLGSLDDVRPFTRIGGSQSPKARMSKQTPCEESEWSKRYPKDFWGTPCARRQPCRMPYESEDGPFIKERKEETVKFRCKERVLTKVKSRKPRTEHSSCRRTDSMQRCSKCCGECCPHPSYLFFR